MLQWLRNADIWTMEAALPRAGSAVVRDGRFAYVGTEEGARAILSGERFDEIDAGGCTVLPGLHDAHMHFLHTAVRGSRVDLSSASSPGEVTAAFRAALAGHGGGWLIGEGWNQERFADRRYLTREALDAASPDVPIIASRACGHVATVNSRALALAGIADRPDGILREGEQGAVWSLVPETTPETLVEMACRAQASLFRAGITSIQSDDLGSVGEADKGTLLRLLRDAGDAGRLKVRYHGQALLPDIGLLRRALREGWHQIRGGRFDVSCVKLLLDGSLGARTAWLQKPYADDPSTSGIALYADEGLAALVREAAGHGLPVAIHVIGDAAMEQALDVLEAEGGGLRHALVHAQITDAGQVARCGRLGLVVMAQPVFLRADAPVVAGRVGDALAGSSYAWRTMLGAGAHVALSTDCPVEPFDPFANLYCATTRRPEPGAQPYLPREAFTLPEAVYAYTMGSAYACGTEASCGSIRAGKQADFVALDRRIDEKTPESLLDTGVRFTVLGGERVFTA